MFDTVISITFRLTAIFGYVLAFVYYMHMFQLNSYKTSVQMKWLRENFIGGYLVRIVPALIPQKPRSRLYLPQESNG